MNLIDSHSHIYLEEFVGDREAMLERAEKEGVTTILLPAIDSSTHERMLALEREHPGICRSMMGVHPCSIKANYKEELRVARAFFEKRKFVAVGETGLDFYWDKTFTDQQYLAFREQIDWALEFDIPLVIHSRNSIDECIDVVAGRQNGNLKGVFHCFSGNIEQARKVMDLGFYLGIGGVVTFKNSGLDKVLEQVSLDHVLLETEAPYLAPVPFRGKRNEPAYLKYVLDKLALQKACSREEVALVTTRNANLLFGKLGTDN
ncbi:MAG TPA: TatD family hydrolase [Chitinophagaceae bacterium]